MPYTHTLLLESPGTTEDASGQINLNDDSNWNQRGRIRARFITKGGKETFRSSSSAYQQVQATGASLIVTPATNLTRQDRLTVLLDPSWRIRLGDRKFNITEITHINMTGREVQIAVTELKRP
jgi:head-tail adaptor